MKGKACAKALICLRTVSEAMQRLLFERFAEEENAEVYNPMGPLNLVQICNRENLDLALSDPNTLTILERYTSYRNLVRNGQFGKTARFWLSVIQVIPMLQYSLKTNNFPFSTSVRGIWLTSFRL